jgi:hypothetical protein
MSLRFVLCVEAGRLEGESLLLCRSIRRFGGRFADAPVSAYRPREGEPIAQATRDELARLDVELIEEPLNRDLAHFPIANKVHAAQHAEASVGERIIVVLDSDAVFLAEPGALELGEGFDAGVSAVGKVGDGSTGPGHRNEPYWERLYELAGATGRPFTETALKGKRVRGYWNSGLVALRREMGLARAWLELMRLLVSKPHLPDRGMDAVDQLALAAVLAREPERIAPLPSTYNYRITRRQNLRPDEAGLDLADLVHVHYMRSFYVRGFLERVEPALRRDSEQFRWLASQLPLQPEIELERKDDEPISWQRIRSAATGQLERKPAGRQSGS